MAVGDCHVNVRMFSFSLNCRKISPLILLLEASDNYLMTSFAKNGNPCAYGRFRLPGNATVVCEYLLVGLFYCKVIVAVSVGIVGIVDGCEVTERLVGACLSCKIRRFCRLSSLFKFLTHAVLFMI